MLNKNDILGYASHGSSGSTVSTTKPKKDLDKTEIIYTGSTSNIYICPMSFEQQYAKVLSQCLQDETFTKELYDRYRYSFVDSIDLESFTRLLAFQNTYQYFDMNLRWETDEVMNRVIEKCTQLNFQLFDEYQNIIQVHSGYTL